MCQYIESGSISSRQTKKQMEKILDTNMHMVVLDQLEGNSDNQTIINHEIISSYNKIRKTNYLPSNNSNRVYTRCSSKQENECITTFHFMRTNIITPQYPHVDYDWEAFENVNEHKIFPTIMFIPLSKEGLMVNVWIKNDQSNTRIEKYENKEETKYLPHKLIVPYGKIVFLDGDVVHAGGIAPSGLRCHGFLYDREDENKKRNTHHIKVKPNWDLTRQCMMPFTDWATYDKQWFYKHQEFNYEKGSTVKNVEAKLFCDRMSEYVPMYQRQCNNKVDAFYKNKCNKKAMLGNDEGKNNICLIRVNCNEECKVGTCIDECTNNRLQMGIWSDTYIKDSTIHGLGLFTSNHIKKDDLIIEYIGEDTLINQVTKPESNYVMQMKFHYIDAERKGSNARFINHSCEPNARIEKVDIDSVQRCGIYANREIKEDEEITCNYGMKEVNVNCKLDKCACKYMCKNRYKFGFIGM